MFGKKKVCINKHSTNVGLCRLNQLCVKDARKNGEQENNETC